MRTDFQEAQKAAAERAAALTQQAESNTSATTTSGPSQEESKTEEAAPAKATETPVKEEPAKATAENVAQSVDNKVVECSILQEAEQAAPAKGSPAAPAEPTPVVEKKRPQASHQEVKLLVKDHTTSLQEALRLITPLFSLIPQAVTFMGPNPLFLQKSNLSMLEAQLLSAFHFVLTTGADRTIEDRLKRVEAELLGLVQSAVEPAGKGDQKIPHFPFDVTYNQIRQLLSEKLLKNKDLLATSPMFQVPPAFGMPTMIPQAAAMAQMAAPAHQQTASQQQQEVVQPAEEEDDYAAE